MHRKLIALTALSLVAGVIGTAQVRAADGVAGPGPVAAFQAPANLEYAPGSVLIRFAPGVPEASRQVLRSLVATTESKTFSLVPDLEHLKIAGDVQAAIDTLTLFGGIVKYAE